MLQIHRAWARNKITTSKCGAFGRSIAIDELHSGEPLLCTINMGQGESLAAGQNLLHSTQSFRFRIDNQIEERRCKPEATDIFCSDDVLKPFQYQVFAGI